MKIEKADLRNERTVYDYAEARALIERNARQAIATAREARSLAAGLRSTIEDRFATALAMQEGPDRARVLDALGSECRRAMAHVN